MYDREAFYHALLDALDAPKNDNNLHALRAWGECEGSAAQYNPLDTTQHEDGATEYNSFESGGSTLHVWNYPDEATGVRATVTTLHNGYYPHIVAALKDGSGKIVSGDARSDMRVWGTNPDCIAKKLDGVLTNDPAPSNEPANRPTETPFAGMTRDQVQRVLRHLATRNHPLTKSDKNLLKQLVKQAQRVVKL